MCHVQVCVERESRVIKYKDPEAGAWPTFRHYQRAQQGWSGGSWGEGDKVREETKARSVGLRITLRWAAHGGF